VGGALDEIIERARSMGAEFQIAGDDRVIVRGLSLLPAEIRDALHRNKTQVFEYLESEGQTPQVIWEIGNLSQIRSLLTLRQAELVLSEAQLTGKDKNDWYLNNRIADLKIKIGDLRKWLSEAIEKEKH